MNQGCTVGEKKYRKYSIVNCGLLVRLKSNCRLIMITRFLAAILAGSFSEAWVSDGRRNGCTEISG